MLIFITILLSVLILYYILFSIQHMFIFGALKVNRALAFIPFYNSYRLFKEYKNRVYKKNWGYLYLTSIAILLSALSILFSQFPFGVNNLTLFFGNLIIAAILFFIFAIMSLIISYLLMLPIMYKPSLRTIYIILFVFNILSGFSGIYTVKIKSFVYVNDINTIHIVVSIISTIFTLIISYKFSKKVANKELVVYEKISSEESTSELLKKLYLREKYLAHYKDKNIDENSKEEFYI